MPAKRAFLSTPIFLLTPPFTQLNTPYPATAYLKGFLNTRGIEAAQADLGIDLTLAVFSKQGLIELFAQVDPATEKTANAQRIYRLRHSYIQTIDSLIRFLQGKEPTLAHRIARRSFLPEAGRFAQLDDLAWAFGAMGTQDKAKHLATMYLEDLSDFIQETVDEHFGFSRYAEKLARSANQFDELYAYLQKPPGFIDRKMLHLLEASVQAHQPNLVAFSVPFPGNLFAALRCGQYLKTQHPGIKIAMGGGFPNTELRSLKDPRVFEFIDFITLDDGEAPLEQLLLYIDEKIPATELKRTYLLEGDTIRFFQHGGCRDYKQTETGTPDYTGLPLDAYIQAIEIINPMHSLWSDGRWNKLTMAHGCYWGKCTFCDISLDYIRLYEPVTASLIADRMEALIQQTGNNGFHFVDEAAPPALMRALALEILQRKLIVSWWTNIRFEKSFTRDLCYLLKASGCIGVSGGLEVASDRLLALIDKGITVAQVAKVNKHFTEAGIMVHAYLMYGFPTQTDQETIDSLEMVRQLFATGVLQSAFWHQFTMTAHSPVGLNPDKYQVKAIKPVHIGFADNDVEHEDPTGADHAAYGYGLKKSLLNFMHGNCLDYPLHKWFDFKVPKTSIAPNYIQQVLEEEELPATKPGTKIVFTGELPASEMVIKSKKGQQWELMELHFETSQSTHTIRLQKEEGAWLLATLPQLQIGSGKISTRQEIQISYETAGLPDFELFWDNKPMNTMYKAGLFQF
ncbi:MAG: radical SAM protein [Flavihumibacter sp. CACIAM 22H1]|nr:MAG: radical SAM protein [Flavihumibacter sp. CACIAM 22H1]